MLLLVLSTLAACDDKETIIVEPNYKNDVSRLDISAKDITMGFVDEYSLNIAVRPADAELTISAEPDIMEIEKGEAGAYALRPTDIGQTTLTVKAGDFTRTIPVTIHSSVECAEYTFMEPGATADIPTLRVLPEGTPYTVTSSDESVIAVDENNRATTVASGRSTMHIETEDGQSKDIVIGVIDAEHTVTAASATAYSYDGTPLGLTQDISALAIGDGNATYADGGTWSDTGVGVFLKLYRNKEYSLIPDGSYTAGTTDFKFAATGNGRSYVIDSGAKDNIAYGDVEIAADGISAKFITEAQAWEFKYAGTRTETPHQYDREYISTDYTNDSFASGGQVAIDHNGTLFYGGYGNGWRFRLRLSNSNYLQIVVWSEDTNTIGAEYPATNGFCDQGTIGAMGWGTTSLLYQNGQTIYFSPGTTIQTPGFARGEESNIILGFKGTFNYSATESVPEIGETRTIPGYANLDVTDFSFSITNETSL